MLVEERQILEGKEHEAPPQPLWAYDRSAVYGMCPQAPSHAENREIELLTVFHMDTSPSE